MRKYLNRYEFYHFVLMAAGALGTLTTFLICRYFNLQLLFAPILILSIFFLVNYRSSGSKKIEILNYLLFGSAVFLTFHFFYTISKSYSRIPEWDFIAFYLYSLAGQSGGNFYDPELFRELFNSYKLGSFTGPVFFEEVVEVGFPYPPPTMILLFPLGWLDVKISYFVWQSIMIIFLIASIYLLLDIFAFMNNEGVEKILFALIITHLILLFPGVTSSFRYAQTNPMLLFFLLLLLKRMHYWDAGVYLAVMIMIKPLAVLFGIWFLLKRKWNVITAATLSGVIIIIISGVIFGFNVFVQYFISPPTDRLPEFVYSEPTNKSLSAVFLRLYPTHLTFMDQSGITTLIIAISLILLLFTIFLSRQLARKSSLVSFLIFIPFALLVYPASLAHYSLLLIPVILAFREQYHYIEKHVFLLLLISIYIAAFVNMFYLNILLFSYFSYLALRLKTQNHSVPDHLAIPGI
jgi:hypothetical protein